MKVFMQKDELFYIRLNDGKEPILGKYQTTRFIRKEGHLIAIEYEFQTAEKLVTIPANDIMMICPTNDKWILGEDIMNGKANKE